MVGQGHEGLRSDGLIQDSFTEAVFRTGINGAVASIKLQNKFPC